MDSSQNKSLVLSLSCQDTPGVVHAVSGLLVAHTSKRLAGGGREAAQP